MPAIKCVCACVAVVTHMRHMSYGIAITYIAILINANIYNERKSQDLPENERNEKIVCVCVRACPDCVNTRNYLSDRNRKLKILCVSVENRAHLLACIVGKYEETGVYTF